MFAVTYRRRLKPDTEDRFREAWKTMTEAIRARSGTSGSRLHRTDDGDLVAYAVWPSRERWEAASNVPPADAEALAAMRECIETSHGATPLTTLDDMIEEITAHRTLHDGGHATRSADTGSDSAVASVNRGANSRDARHVLRNVTAHRCGHWIDTGMH